MSVEPPAGAGEPTPDPAAPDGSPVGVPHLLADLGGRRIALPLDALLEVADLGAVTPLPDAPPWLLGITNLRGAIVSVVHLATLLGWEVAHPGRRAFLLRDGRFRLAVPVDAVQTVHWLDGSEGGEATAASLVTQERTSDGRQVWVVSAEAVLAQVRRGDRAAAGR